MVAVMHSVQMSDSRMCCVLQAPATSSVNYFVSVLFR